MPTITQHNKANERNDSPCYHDTTERSFTKISGYRHAVHSDLPRLEALIQPMTYELFGDVKLEQLYEISCLSMIQCNEEHEIVSGIFLCNYPNVTSVMPCDWVTWLETIYGIPTGTESDTLFVHLLVWDERYENQFLRDLLTALFDITVYCQYVILIIPPAVKPERFVKQEMTRIVPKGMLDINNVQFLYFSTRDQIHPKLKIRRVVEEDNDDLIPIIDEETTRLREHYGEYFISEMVRYPDGRRQLIIGEDVDGMTMGVMCLNSTIDIDLLNENFELTPYNDLKKPPCEDVVEESSDTDNLSETIGSTENKGASTEENGREIPPVTKSTAQLRNLSIDISTYQDKINAFVLEIFAMHEGTRVPQWSWDFLKAAFDCFPDLEYCIVLLPFSHQSLEFLQHFVRVPLRYDKDFPMTLYLVHRAVLLGEIKCRRAEVQDRQAVERLLPVTPSKHEILANFERAIDPAHNLDCFVFKCNNVTIGLAILRTEEKIDLIRNLYHLEDYVSMQNIPQDSYGRLLHFILTPIFAVYHRSLLCEITRLSGLTVILYRLYHEENCNTLIYPSCLDNMIPVNPRRQAEYRFLDITKNINSLEGHIKNSKTNDEDTFSLYMTTPRLAMMPLVIIDMKIVIVGASDCGIAFAEYLALRSMQRYMQFTNLTLISPHGLPFDDKLRRTGTRLLPFRGRYCLEYRRCVAARTWINVVYGTMTAINRKDKYVTLMDREHLAYDYLVLTCGLQYQKPIFRGRTKAQEREMTAEIEEVPWNCLTINDDTEAYSSLNKIQLITKDLREQKHIVFYGHNVDCYCAIHGLMEFGVKASWITLIETSLDPCETHDDVFFNHKEIDEAVMDAISRSGVRILSGWNMTDWTLTMTANGKFMIDSVTVKKRGVTRTLTCDVLFNFHEKTLNPKTFLAFCRTGLVFDGLLVIDPDYRTNDPFIFAAGTVTKYSRKFYADSWQHRYYNSVEIGERLAEILRDIIDIDLRRRGNREISVPRRKEKSSLTLPVFRAPIIIACILPGNYYYLHVCKPGKKAPRDIIQNFYDLQTCTKREKKSLLYTEISILDLRKFWIINALQIYQKRILLCMTCVYNIDYIDIQEEALVTGSCVSEIGYFCIRFNTYDTIESVTCVNRKIFDVKNMISLYGKHDSMLNELKLRFRNSYISDFYAYFREPWTAAIFHDRFQCLRVENRATLLSRMDDNFLVNDCVQALNKSKWEAMSKKDRSYIESKYAGSAYHQEIERSLINFLEFHEDDLLMYCTPSKQRQMYTDIAESPLYFEQ